METQALFADIGLLAAGLHLNNHIRPMNMQPTASAFIRSYTTESRIENGDCPKCRTRDLYVLYKGMAANVCSGCGLQMKCVRDVGMLRRLVGNLPSGSEMFPWAWENPEENAEGFRR